MPTTLDEQLLQAAKNGQPKKIQALIDLGADVNHVSDHRATSGLRPLEMAIESGDIASIKALLKNNAVIDYPENYKALYGHRSTALALACDKGFVNAVKLLVEHGAKIDVPDGDNPPLISAMILSRSHNLEIKNNALTIINYLVDNGANLNCRNSCAGTPLMIATRLKDNDYELLRTLLEKGADLNQPLYAGNNETLLIVLDDERYNIDGAAKHIIKRHARTLGLLSENEVDSVMRKSLDDQLVIAAAIGNPILIDSLVKQGANVNAKATKSVEGLNVRTDDTAFMVAARVTDISLMEKLNSIGADNSGLLNFAISENNFPVAEFLLDKINKDELNKGLRYGCYNCYTDKNEMIKLLLSKGADINFKGDNGETTFEMVVKRNQSGLVSILLASGQPVSNQDIKGILERNYHYINADIEKMLKSHMESNDLSVSLNNSVSQSTMT